MTPVEFSDPVKSTVAALRVRTGWSMIRFAVMDCGRSGAPTAVMATDAAPGLALRPVGFAVRVTVLPVETAQVSHGAGLAGQLTGPNRPSPPFSTEMVFTIEPVVPRTARKSTDGYDSTISTAGARFSAQPDASRAIESRPTCHRRPPRLEECIT
jgi:hypothetical protein